jgi:hypothetical protein
VIEWLRGISSSQQTILKPRALVFLQDTFHALHISNPRLPSVFGIIRGMAWAKPSYQIYYFVILAQTNAYLPISYPVKYSIIALPTFYLDPNRPPIILSPLLISQHQFHDTDFWACPLCIGETEFDGTIMREDEVEKKESQVIGHG